ncbi:MAG: DUF1499 domain-containing protein [Rhodothermales bacterium]
MQSRNIVCLSSLLCLLLLCNALLFTPAVLSQDLSSSPLQSCPESPNCVHQTHSYQILSSDLSDHVIAVLKEMGAESIDIGQVDHHEIHAVFKVWTFRDDVHIAITQLRDSATLYIRSASRKGHNDLGVNKRRVKKFLSALDKAI